VWRKRLYLRDRNEAEWIEKQRRQLMSIGSRSFEFITSRKGLIIQLGVALLVALLWRPGWHEAIKNSDLRALIALFSLIPLYMLLTLVGTQIAGIIRFHREKGTPEEAQKVEWIRASYVVILVLLAVPVNLLPLWMVLGFLGGEPVVMWMIHHNVLVNSVYALMLAFMASPLIYLLALGASIFARGTIDPRLAVRGFTLWTLLGLVITFLFVLIERAVAMKVVAVFKLPPESGAVVAGAIIAATFIPIRGFAEKWVRRWVERWMPATLLASGERRQAAVVLIDITGYSALSARDESSAVIAATLLQKECRRAAELHNGRVIKSTGDGALLAFAAAGDAVRAVPAIHAAFAAGSLALSLPNVDLHSGIHWGEIVELHDGDIYGQTVNTAARIADFAKAGEIMLSGAAAAEVAAHSVALQSAGEQRFKNLPEPVPCFRLA
jgi:class 3 adenylate cyclase